jgi:catechol 2,3-dioxygenase-like lactoylglutathione lyase family enzyme
MRFRYVELAAARGRLDDQHAFYAHTLGLPTRPTADGFAVSVGETSLEFIPGAGEPFYHFALLVPGDRFAAALDWIGRQTELLGHRNTSDLVFDFAGWNARACYFHDPAGNIVELIAHHDMEHSRVRAPFQVGELLGISELGLVGQPSDMAPPLTGRMGLAVWDGRVADQDSLAFVGVKARTLILVPTGRGWLPTGRPAELHPVGAVLSGDRAAAVELEDGLYRISRRP